jgi:transposase
VVDGALPDRRWQLATADHSLDLEIHDVGRFERVQEFVSYVRLVRCAKESGGKKLGTGGAKMGNVHLKAAVLFVRHSAEGKKILARLEKRFGKGKASSILAHKHGRAVYYMLARGTAFDAKRFAATLS